MANKPTHKLVMKHKNTGAISTIGAVWTTPSRNGDFLSLKLNPGTVISHRDCEDHFLGIFESTDRDSEFDKGVRGDS